MVNRESVSKIVWFGIVLKQLAQPFLNPNRNAFMDRYFTSFSTVEYFLEHGLRAVGTVFAHRRDVPARLRKTARH
ncbi:hypothetical protein T02_2732 [Trichinella nativa]|uniref:PiggyBac transposable element-derived protein domain-containing protein n=1 Tax=Trichinella nativa TaxID=6335 RepID=A0A0V1KUM1_9BILA|nr:hypothetical protein T02_2732 [Trichinella nativa]